MATVARLESYDGPPFTISQRLQPGRELSIINHAWDPPLGMGSDREGRL